ncbi:MAG: hypothetical protein GMKNLPBB_02508 [Myxococcota bacterium]|nr:hypothetical protein [Myxococcota bacterium]
MNASGEQVLNAFPQVSLLHEWLAAWTGNRPEALAAFYADDCYYSDPAHPAGLRGRERLEGYLRKLLARNPAWVWRLDQVWPVDGGCVIRWRAEIPVSTGVIHKTGMDLVLIRDGRITRNEVYFDPSGLGG